jgi:hypothetical protein
MGSMAQSAICLRSSAQPVFRIQLSRLAMVSLITAYAESALLSTDTCRSTSEKTIKWAPMNTVHVIPELGSSASDATQAPQTEGLYCKNPVASAPIS